MIFPLISQIEVKELSKVQYLLLSFKLIVGGIVLKSMAECRPIFQYKSVNWQNEDEDKRQNNFIHFLNFNDAQAFFVCVNNDLIK